MGFGIMGSMSIIEALKKGITTHSAEETQGVGEQLAQALPINCVIALVGDLGTGKTTFVGGLARGWGIEEPITSPTFNLFCTYKSEQRYLLHLDAYRLTTPQSIEDLMLDEFLETPYCLAVEWP